MAWDFSTEPTYQKKLDWARAFVDEEIGPLDVLWPNGQYNPLTAEQRRIVDPLKAQVRKAQLWACHLGGELGGQGYGQLKLALLNEILGRSEWAPTIFGTQAPDSGNAEILARFGTPDQKARYLQPLLDGDILSCFSMTEPQSGADPAEFTTTAVRDGSDWVINGWKFFSSNARWAAFMIVMAYTDATAGPHRGMSMFLVPSETSGVNIVRNVGIVGHPAGTESHALIHYEDVRVPESALLGGEGEAFSVAQTRLGGGRVHHAMRTIGLCQRALDMMCERALSRRTRGSLLGEQQAVQFYVADSYAQIRQFRLLVLETAWKIDRLQDYKQVRKEISIVKALTPQVLHDVVQRAMQVHGALGLSDEMPLARMWVHAQQLGVVDGPTEVHKVSAARAVLAGYRPAVGLWPSEHIPARLAAARAKVSQVPVTS
jgi:acyl-CoA dehydrogenase